ncbi:lipase family protein [Corynebacterium sp. TAE3-ERU12]|uniref:lipase family protein n=1 Tax=Corynebacterium sp. TAE3-ERU12 TaxID=2849491 RepID=UPI001C474D6C|nr:lipase family protein [Corynebacterium sp. TAE3-ERU12]MBV7294985.1 lipase family protein [Corynebacterium sp. TAE3-ERU12]
MTSTRTAAIATTSLLALFASAAPAYALPAQTTPAGPSSEVGSIAAVGESPAQAEFYTQIPDDLGQAGDVLKTQPAPHLLELTGLKWPGSATRIMYTSTRQNGALTPVTGVVIEPTTPWRGAGQRPTVIIAPGTMGQGDQCAPSRGTGLFAGITAQPSLALNYELPMMYALAQRGIRVILTDYIGLGTPGLHTYGNYIDQAQAVLDAGRAALGFAGASPDAPVGIYGYSQGGGASGAAAEHQPIYAPELNVTGAYLGAVPANLRDVIRAIDGGTLAGAIGYGLNAGLVYQPQLGAAIDGYLNEQGREFMATTQTQCLADSGVTWGFQKTRELTTTGQSFSDLVADIPELGDYLDAQSLAKSKPEANIMVEIGVNDDIVPVEQARQLGRDYCAMGSNVQYLENDTPVLIPKTALNHVVPLFGDIPEALMFFMDSFTGGELPNDCGTF